MVKQTGPAAPEGTTEPETMDVHQSLLSLLEAEDAPQGKPEEPRAEEQPAESKSSEAGGDEAEVESEEQSEQEVGEEESAESKGDEPKYQVRVNGKLVEATLEELKSSFSFNAHNMQKSQALAEERKALESERKTTEETLAAVRAEREQYAERLEAMKTFLDQHMPAEPPEKLRTENPAEYAAQWADYQRNQTAREKVVTEQERVRQQQVADQQAQLQAVVARERERLLDALPSWKNPETLRKEQETLIAYGTSVGFTEDELANLYDHRAVLILDKARRYDELQKKGQAVKEKAVTAPVLKPGQPAPKKTIPDALQKTRERFQKTGHPKDAAALIEHYLAQEGR